MNQDKQKFIDKYKEIAIQQQLKYGIPASITLAQAILESSYGTSKQAKECKNFFGVKKGESWKGDTEDYLDDHSKAEPFRKYSNPEQSFEDHSKILTTNNGKVAKACKGFSATDYQGWAHAIAYSGYCNLKGSATYEQNLLGEISDYNLHAIDLEAENRRKNGEVAKQTDNRHVLQPMSGNFAMPIDFSKDIEVSSEFGMRKHPIKGKMLNHNGVDISTNGQHLPVFATEDKGKVVKVGFQEKGAGNYVTVEYNRPDGAKFRTTYMHLSDVNVKENDIVNANQQLGVTGSTGGSTGVHLHFEVREFDGKSFKAVSPVNYLAKLQLRSGEPCTLEKGGKDYLAEARSNMVIGQSPTPESNLLADKTNSNDPTKWLAKLMEQNGEMPGDKQDMISSLISMYFTKALCLVAGLTRSEIEENLKKEQEQQQVAENSSQTTAKKDETVNAKDMKQTASNYFEAEMQQDNLGQNQGRRIG